MNDTEIPNSIEEAIQYLAADIVRQIKSENPEEFVKIFLLCIPKTTLIQHLEIIVEKGISHADRGILRYLERLLLGDFFDS